MSNANTNDANPNNCQLILFPLFIFAFLQRNHRLLLSHFLFDFAVSFF